MYLNYRGMEAGWNQRPQNDLKMFKHPKYMSNYRLTMKFGSYWFEYKDSEVSLSVNTKN